MAQQIIPFGTNRAEAAAFQLSQKGMTLQRIDGYCNGANTWLQLHDSTSAPLANAVPKKSVQLFGNDGFSYVFGGQDEICFQSGIYVALSTSEVNYVADVSGTKISGDVTVNNLDHDTSNEAGLTVVGDLTTGVDFLQVWAEAASNSAAGAKHLVRLDIINGTGAAAWLQIFATDSVAVGSVPIISIPLGCKI